MAEVRYIPAKERKPSAQQANKAQLDANLVIERAETLRARRQQSEMLLAKARGELITKQLVERQAAYLLVALRQRIMSIPSTYARQIVNLPDRKAAAAVLKEIAISVLNEIRDLPQKVVNPDWLKELEEAEEETDGGES